MGEARELDKLTGDRIGDTGLALSLERGACHLPAHVARNGCRRKNSEVCGSRAPVNRRGGCAPRNFSRVHPDPDFLRTHDCKGDYLIGLRGRASHSAG
jgi:hypothetical protein